LLCGSFVGPWLQNSIRNVGAMASQMAGATAQDGGLPVPGLLTKVDPATRHAMVKEFFLT
jgi:hypothetical protein